MKHAPVGHQIYVGDRITPGSGKRWQKLAVCAVLFVALTIFPVAGSSRNEQVDSSARILYVDDFRSQKHWKEGTGGACKTKYGDGGFIVEDVPPPGTCEFDLVQAGYFNDSVRIEVSAKLRKGDQGATFGLKFGRSAPDNNLFYTFTVSANGTYDLAMNNGDWRSLISRTDDSVVRKGYGASNRIAVEVRGRAIRCFVNDKFVGSATSPADVRGNVGFYLDMMGMEAVFTELRVMELPTASASGTATAGRTLYTDDLASKQTLPVGTAMPCKTAYTDGGFSLEDVASEGTCEFTLANVGNLPANVRIEVSAALRKGSQRSSFGLKFGRPSQDNHFFYTLTVNADGYYRLSQWDGTWRYPIDWTEDAVLNRGYGARNRLAVEVQGRAIRCYVNDKFVGSTVSPSDVQGEAGLFLARPGMEAVFSNLRVAEMASR